MKLDKRIINLIGIGASITANCQPCLQTMLTKTRESGAEEDEIMEAFEVGKMIRKGAISKMDKFILDLNQSEPLIKNDADKGCECNL